MLRKTFFAVLAFSTSVANAAEAEPAAAPGAGSCQLKQVASIELFMKPEMTEVLMRTTLNGVPKYMAIALGQDYKVLSRETAAELNLEVKHYPIEMTDHVFVRDFTFAGYRVRHMDFILLARREQIGASDFAGAMSPNLRAYDVELDLAAGRMNLFEPSSCIAGPYWANSGAASIDLEAGRFHPFYFPLVLDGKRVLSDIDSILTTTTIRARPARALFDIDPVAMHLPAIPNDVDSDPLYAVVLHTLATEDGAINIANPHFMLVPGWSRYFGNDEPVVSLGLSILKSLHVYVAFGRRKLFVTAASGPPKIAPLPKLHPQTGRTPQ